MIEFVLGQDRPTPSYEPASHRITATSIERREATYSIDGMAAETARQGHAAWTELHTTLCDDPTPEKVAAWEAMIPSYGCGCRQGYQTLKAEHPFDYSSPDAFFVSTVHLHNAVNRKLVKPEMSIEEARTIWNRPAP